jgi:hypothetical protein
MHSKGVYQIPYRCLYSRNIKNLFLAGRLISVSHVAFGSTRVMATTGHTAQAVGLAAAQKKLPAEVDVTRLQRELLRTGHYIPHLVVEDKQNLVHTARVEASSSQALAELKPNGETLALDGARAMLVPVAAGAMPRVTLRFDTDADAAVELQLRASEREGNFTPDVTLSHKTVKLVTGKNRSVTVDFGVQIDKPRYVFVCVMPAAGVRVHLSDQRVTGVLSLMHGANKKVAKSAVQKPATDVGVDTFEFWIPERRPGGKNLAVAFEPPLAVFAPANVLQGPTRPTTQPNAWVAGFDDAAPRLTLAWSKPQTIGRIELSFDTDFDHAMETVQWGHPERAMPFCVKRYRIRDGKGSVIAECGENHQTRNVVKLPTAVTTDRLVIECLSTHGTPAAIMEVRCYED